MMKNEYDKALTRLASITQRLYEGATLTKKDLAIEFNVSEKTIQRDINKRLRNIPVVKEKGVGFKLNSDFLNANIAQKYSQIIEQGRSMEYLELSLRKASEAIETADAILISAGAGMGVDSGLPDFRGDDGFWRAYPPLKKLRLKFHDIANPVWFEKDPKMAWGFYGHRLNLYRNTEPHGGFEILKKLSEFKKDNYFIFTSNVDGQFQKAGFDSDNIIEVHGSIHHNQCSENCGDDIWSNRDLKLNVNLESFLITSELPKCKSCSKLARPNIMMFGDYGFNQKRSLSQQARLQSWIRENVLKKNKIVIIEIGAGKDVPTVRNFSDDIMSQYNATLIRINPRDYDGNAGTIQIPLGVLEALEKIYN
jgi:NAD-dependent SIR2 family protein deacetylase